MSGCFFAASRRQARAAALLRPGVLAADGGLLERRPFPETPAWNRGAQLAKHHGPAVQLRLGAEEQQPGGFLLNTPHPPPHPHLTPLTLIYEQ